MIGKLFKMYGGANFNQNRILIVLGVLDERYVQYASYCINDNIISIQRVNIVGIQRLIDNGNEILVIGKLYGTSNDILLVLECANGSTNYVSINRKHHPSYIKHWKLGTIEFEFLTENIWKKIC